MKTYGLDDQMMGEEGVVKDNGNGRHTQGETDK